MEKSQNINSSCITLFIRWRHLVDKQLALYLVRWYDRRIQERRTCTKDQEVELQPARTATGSSGSRTLQTLSWKGVQCRKSQVSLRVSCCKQYCSLLINGVVLLSSCLLLFSHYGFQYQICRPIFHYRFPSSQCLITFFLFLDKWLFYPNQLGRSNLMFCLLDKSSWGSVAI